eukprot:scaffold4492_cov81-Skeletonema_menzelii.AAC.1
MCVVDRKGQNDANSYPIFRRFLGNCSRGNKEDRHQDDVFPARHDRKQARRSRIPSIDPDKRTTYQTMLIIFLQE